MKILPFPQTGVIMHGVLLFNCSAGRRTGLKDAVEKSAPGHYLDFSAGFPAADRVVSRNPT